MSLFMLKHICIPKKTVSSPWLRISEGCRILRTRHLRGMWFRNGLLCSFLSSSHRLQHIAYISILHKTLQSLESNILIRFTVCKTPSAKGFRGGFGTNQGNLALWAHPSTWPFRVLQMVHELSAPSVFVPLTLRWPA